MRGKNKVSGPFHSTAGTLLVNSWWHTLQGEGPDAGHPAIFVRLAKCNLRCYFCDTEFEDGKIYSYSALADEICLAAKAHKCHLVVITGGEPLLQNIIPFVKAVNARGLAVTVETAGTVYCEDIHTVFSTYGYYCGNLIICSPKTPLLNKQILPYIGALKYIIRNGEYSDDDGLPMRSTQIEGQESVIYRPGEGLSANVPIYVQPMDEGDADKNKMNMQAATRICLKHGYRLSLQMHKIVGVD